MKHALSIAFKGQLYKNDASSANFVYPQFNTDWAQLLGSDPRKTIADLNINGDHRCYTICITDNGIIYAYRRILSGRSGSNCAMVLLKTGGPTTNGKLLTEKLHEFLTYAMSQPSSDQIDINYLDEKLSACETFFDWQRCPNSSEKKENESQKEAYREYKTEDELIKFLENPLQPVYRKYCCIHIVPSESNANPALGSNIELLSENIEPVYFFSFPQGVEEKDGKKYVGRSDYFSLVYKRQGYNDFSTGTLRPGGDLRYYIIEKDIIKVKSAEEAKIKFRKPFQFRVTNEKNIPIDKYLFRIKENGSNRWVNWPVGNNQTRDVTIGQKGIISCSLPEGQYEYLIEAEGYGKKNGQIDTRNSNLCEVTLKPEIDELELFLIPAFYKKKKNENVTTEAVTFNYTKNNILYKKYSKSFDKKYLSKPPVFYVMRKNPKSILILFCLLSLLVGLGIGILIRLNKDPDKNTGGTNPSVSCVEPGENPFETKETPESVDSTKLEDEKYLSENDVWERTNIKSTKYIKFFDILVFRDPTSSQNHNVTDYGILVSTDDCYSRIKNDKWEEIRSKIKDASGNGWNSTSNSTNDLKQIRDNITNQANYCDRIDLSLIISGNNETNPSHNTRTTSIQESIIPDN